MHTNFEGISHSDRIIRLPEVMLRTGLKRSTIYLRIQQGAFPKQLHLGVNCCGWLESEVSAWIASRVIASRGHLGQPP